VTWGADGGRGSAAAVLVVCEGNICRSPAAELLWRAAVGSRFPVASAGLRARVGEPVHEPIARLLRARGLSPDGVGRQLTPELVGAADLVLTMTTAQRAGVLSWAPGAVRRTFTLREFAGLVALIDPAGLPGPADPAARLAALVDAAPRARARRGVAADDVEDPYRRPDDVAARAVALIADAVDGIATALTGDVLTPREQPRADVVLPSGELPVR
jgi:protein-tyrosine phosphatase